MRSLPYFLRGRTPSFRLARGEQVLLMLSSLCSALLTPAHRAAACEWDIECAGQSAIYPLYVGMASMIWTLNRMLLLLTYQLEQLRAWLIGVVFTSVYDTLTKTITPGLAPFATVAVVIGVLAFLAMPIFGKIEIVNIRRALVWIAIGPLLLAISGGWLGQIEAFRTNVGNVLFNAAAGAAPGDIFGARAGDMPTEAVKLYPSAACGTPLTRAFPQVIDGESVPQMDDLAATMLYADAVDIHCPQIRASQPGRGMLPLKFYESPQPNYAYDGDIAGLDEAKRAEAIANIQQGANRLLLGIIPSILAVCFALIQLVFSFALVAIWVSLPIGLLFVFFNDTAGGVTGLFRRIVTVLQASWTASLMMGIVFAALVAAAGTGNAAAYTGLSVSGILMAIYIMKSAVETLLTSMKTISASLGAATGMSGGTTFAKAAVGGMVGGAAGAALATMSAGKDATMTGMAAYQGSGRNGRYAAAAALGRIKPVAKLGEVASMMGVTNEWTEGIYASKLAAKNKDGGTAFRKMRDLSAKDQGKKVSGDDGQTFGERAQERALARELAPRNPVGRSINRWRTVGRSLNKAGAALEDAAQQPGQTALLAARTLAKPAAPVRRAVSGIRADARSAYTPGGTSRAVVRALANGRVDSNAGQRMMLTDKGKRQYIDRVADDQIPESAVTEYGNERQQARWLQRGEHVQKNLDGSYTHWDGGEALREPADAVALDDDGAGLVSDDVPVGPGPRAGMVIHRARVNTAARALDREHRTRRATGGGKPWQRAGSAPGRRRGMTPPQERVQRSAMIASLREERVTNAEIERRQAQRQRAQDVLARGAASSEQRRQHRAGQRGQESPARFGQARAWKRKLNQTLPLDPAS